MYVSEVWLSSWCIALTLFASSHLLVCVKPFIGLCGLTRLVVPEFALGTGGAVIHCKVGDYEIEVVDCGRWVV